MKWLGAALLVLAACDSAPVIEVATSCPKTCNDGDPCTDDRCDLGTFACLHVPRGVEAACRQDDHCDDHDGCTLDICGVDEQCGWQRCRHDIIEDCKTCGQAFECDDQNGCTTDRCSERTCQHETVEHCDPRCNPWFARGPSVTRAGPASVRGRIYPVGELSCDEGCLCDHGMALIEGPGKMPLVGIDDTCEVDACEQTFTCEGFQPDLRGYVFFGNAVSDEPTVAGQAPLADRLEVEGWCVSLENGLAGAWDATLQVDDEDLPVVFRLASQGDFAVVTVNGDERISIFDSPASIRDGSTLGLSFMLDGRPLFAELHAQEDRLAGVVFDPNSFSDEEKPDPGMPFEPQSMKRVGWLALALTY